MAARTRNVDHRPWPLPARPWVMRMRWAKLLFAHWPVDADRLRRELPAGMELDCWDGRGWIGVVPFRMEDTAPRGVPAVPGLSQFLELNVRTYVSVDGMPGVWFFSLDAASRLAVRAARSLFHLPYFDARMTLSEESGSLHSVSERTHRDAPSASFEASFGPCGPVEFASPGSLEHWLTERYCLYSADRTGRIWRGHVHHDPWPLQRASAEISRCQMLHQDGLTLDGEPTSLLYADRIDVAAWALEPATAR